MDNKFPNFNFGNPNVYVVIEVLDFNSFPINNFTQFTSPSVENRLQFQSDNNKNKTLTIIGVFEDLYEAEVVRNKVAHSRSILSGPFNKAPQFKKLNDPLYAYPYPTKTSDFNPSFTPAFNPAVNPPFNPPFNPSFNPPFNQTSYNFIPKNDDNMEF